MFKWRYTKCYGSIRTPTLHGITATSWRTAVRGVCLQRYSTTLRQGVDRHAKAKDERNPALSEREKRRLMQGIRDGVAHLHLLGLAHNGLNPSNNMVEGNAPVIIDFDSCRRQGEPMGMKGSRPGWGTSAGYADRESDMRNLDQIQRYLFGSSHSPPAHEPEQGKIGLWLPLSLPSLEIADLGAQIPVTSIQPGGVDVLCTQGP